MADIIDLADHRPHLTIRGAYTAHVVPCKLVEDVIANHYYPGVLGDDVLRVIVSEWYAALAAANGERGK